MKWFKTNRKWSTKWAYSPDFRLSCLIVPYLEVRSLLKSLDTLTDIFLYWSPIVPGNKWQYGGVISMFCICQRNAESMTKQWHTLYGYAVRPEKVSWTSPYRVSSSSLRRSTPPFRRHGHGVGHIAWARRTLKIRALRASMAMSIYGEERERKQFVAAVKDGYVLCEWVFHSVLTFVVAST